MSKKEKNDRFVALDFETMDTLRFCVCSIGAVVFENGKVVDKYYTLVCPPSKYENPYCVQTHGIRYNDVKDAPTFEEAWKKVDEIIGESKIIAHNAPFEKSCINACNEEFGTNNEYQYIDTLKLSRKYVTDTENHKLNTLCDKFNIKLEHYHNALDDAEACGKLYVKLKEKYILND